MEGSLRAARTPAFSRLWNFKGKRCFLINWNQKLVKNQNLNLLFADTLLFFSSQPLNYELILGYVDMFLKFMFYTASLVFYSKKVRRYSMYLGNNSSSRKDSSTVIDVSLPFSPARIPQPPILSGQTVTRLLLSPQSGFLHIGWLRCVLLRFKHRMERVGQAAAPPALGKTSCGQFPIRTRRPPAPWKELRPSLQWVPIAPVAALSLVAIEGASVFCWFKQHWVRVLVTCLPCAVSAWKCSGSGCALWILIDGPRLPARGCLCWQWLLSIAPHGLSWGVKLAN